MADSIYIHLLFCHPSPAPSDCLLMISIFITSLTRLQQNNPYNKLRRTRDQLRAHDEKLVSRFSELLRNETRKTFPTQLLMNSSILKGKTRRRIKSESIWSMGNRSALLYSKGGDAVFNWKPFLDSVIKLLSRCILFIQSIRSADRTFAQYFWY